MGPPQRRDVSLPAAHRRVRPGCDRTRFTDGHHVEHWAGGETKLSNLISLCGFHHKLVHEGGFGVTVTDDGVFVFTRPDGRRIPACGPRSFGSSAVGMGERFSGSASPSEAERFSGSAPSADDYRPDGSLKLDSVEDALRFQMQRLNPGVPIDAHTSRRRWLGERMDYNAAIEACGSAMDGLDDSPYSEGTL